MTCQLVTNEWPYFFRYCFKVFVFIKVFTLQVLNAAVRYEKWYLFFFYNVLNVQKDERFAQILAKLAAAYKVSFKEKK